MANMRVVQVSRAKGPFEVVEREIPQVKIEACGICHSDSMTKEWLWRGIDSEISSGTTRSFLFSTPREAQ